MVVTLLSNKQPIRLPPPSPDGSPKTKEKKKAECRVFWVIILLLRVRLEVVVKLLTSALHIQLHSFHCTCVGLVGPTSLT